MRALSQAPDGLCEVRRAAFARLGSTQRDFFSVLSGGAGRRRARICTACRSARRTVAHAYGAARHPAAHASTLRYRLCVRHLPRARLYVALLAMCAPPMVAPHHWVCSERQLRRASLSLHLSNGSF